MKGAAQELFSPLLLILSDHPGGISEYELMNELSRRGIPPFAGMDDHTAGEGSSGQLRLFRSHFFLFNTLYQLRDRLRANGRDLSIFCLDIRLGNKSSDSSPAPGREFPVVDDPLREYYMDWSNFEDMDESGVQSLMEDAAKALRAYYQRADLYSLLDLEPECSNDQLQKRYRQLCLLHHPDAGGDSLMFTRVQQAMEDIRRLPGRSGPS